MQPHSRPPSLAFDGSLSPPGPPFCRPQVFLHVSTSFVNGMRRGLARERPFHMNETIAEELGWEEAPKLDIRKGAPKDSGEGGEWADLDPGDKLVVDEVCAGSLHSSHWRTTC